MVVLVVVACLAVNLSIVFILSFKAQKVMDDRRRKDKPKSDDSLKELEKSLKGIVKELGCVPTSVLRCGVTIDGRNFSAVDCKKALDKLGYKL